MNVSEFKDIVESSQGDSSLDFINVCTPQEYAAEHIEGVRSVPLDELEQHVPEFKDKKKIYVHCRSGGRSRMAIEHLKHMGITAQLVNVEGGLLAWGDAGYPTKSL